MAKTDRHSCCPLLVSREGIEGGLAHGMASHDLPSVKAEQWHCSAKDSRDRH